MLKLSKSIKSRNNLEITVAFFKKKMLLNMSIKRLSEIKAMSLSRSKKIKIILSSLMNRRDMD